MAAKSKAGTAFQGFCLLMVRVALAAILLGRAWWRWSIEGLDQQIELLTGAGVPQPAIIAWGTLALECIGGVLLALGLLTRLIGLLVLVQNILIIALIRWPNGPYSNYGGYEYNLALAMLGLVFLAFGSFHTGLDGLLFGRKKDDELGYHYQQVSEYQPA